MRRPMRRFVVILLALTLLAAGMPARAEEKIRVVLGNHEISFDVPPALVNGRVLVPLRKIFEALGAKVSYDPATKQISVWKGPISVELSVDDPAVLVDGESKKLDVAPQVVDGRTLVPLRFVSEALGGQVAWDPATRTVSILTPAGTASPSDMVLTATDLPGGKWTEIERPTDLPQGWQKVMVSIDTAEPYAWISSALQPMGEGASAWVKERGCRSGETEVPAPQDLILWNTVKFCQGRDAQGNLVVTAYVAAGEYVLTMAASPRNQETLAADVTGFLEELSLHQLILLGKLARGEARPAPLTALPAPGERPAGRQGAKAPAENPTGQPEQQPEPQPKPVLQPVELPPAPAPLKFALIPPLRIPAGTDKEKVIFSFCTPQPASKTSPCGPMPRTTDPTGGNPPYHFVLGTGGGFPPVGVTLLKDGHLVGEPDPADVGRVFKFVVCAVDLSANQVCHQVLFTVTPSLLQFAAPTLPRATEGQQYEATVPSPTGGQPPYRFEVQGEGLPAGMWLDDDGTLTGWPSTGTGGKTHTFMVCVEDAAQHSACREVTLQVDPKPPTLVEQLQNTSWSGTFTINFAKFAPETGTIAFKIGPDEGYTDLKVTEATVSFRGWRFKFRNGYLSCINENKCHGLVLDFALLEDGPTFSQPGSLEWYVRGLTIQVGLLGGDTPTRVDSQGVIHELTATSMKGRAETYSLNPPGTFSATRR